MNEKIEGDQIPPLQRYELIGPQVEPEAGYWAYFGKRIEVVDVDTLPDNTIRPFDLREVPDDLEELRYLNDPANRRNPDIVEGSFPRNSNSRRRRKLSVFPVPATASHFGSDQPHARPARHHQFEPTMSATARCTSCNQRRGACPPVRG